MFDLTANTPITIDGKIHNVRFYDGMSGIGSRIFWIDDQKYSREAVRHTEDLTSGNHLLYLIKWRDTPWDKVFMFIHEKYEDELLSDENIWREPKKISLE